MATSSRRVIWTLVALGTILAGCGSSETPGEAGRTTTTDAGPGSAGPTLALHEPGSDMEAADLGDAFPGDKVLTLSVSLLVEPATAVECATDDGSERVEALERWQLFAPIVDDDARRLRFLDGAGRFCSVSMDDPSGFTDLSGEPLPPVQELPYHQDFWPGRATTGGFEGSILMPASGPVGAHPVSATAASARVEGE